MKTIHLTAVLAFIMFTGNLFAQQKQEINLADSTGLPGDHFSLQGALAMFKESTSIEDFEKRLNDKDNAVNNLDLNGDGKVDYVRVVSDKKDNAHIIILQVPVSKSESQDVAVIQLEKDGENSAFVQILGDEDLYGDIIIVEPKEDGEPSDPGVIKKGPAGYSYIAPRFYFNVWYWPCVQYMYAPVYVVYISPWYWDYWPGWWSPWYPYPWRYHYMSSWHYHHHYHYAPYHRTTHANQVYAPRRSRSNQVNDRFQPARRQYEANQGSRPRPGAVMNQSRPKDGVQTKPGTRPTQPVVRPGQPQTKPGTRPEQAPARPMPQTKPQTRPEQAPARPQQQTKPSTRPEQAPERPQTKPSTRPDDKPQARPQESRPKTNPQSRPQSNPKSTPPRQQRNPR